MSIDFFQAKSNRIQQAVLRFWYSKNRLRYLLYPLSWLISLIARLKRVFYLAGWLKSQHPAVPVVVVGNITLGGTGKTPLISLLVKTLQARGKKVGLVSRGYQSQCSSYPHLVQFFDSAEKVGDEAYMQYHICNSSQTEQKVPVAIGSNRAQAVELLTSRYPLDLVISDDGLQHYAMQRDFEILLVDSSRQFGNGLMLPFGPLREPLSRLNSVDFLIENCNSGLAATRLNHKVSPACLMRLRNTGLYRVKDNQKIAIHSVNPSQESIYAVAGIGNPQRFFDSLKELLANFIPVSFPDHHAFALQDFNCCQNHPVVMTEKDAVKCQNFAKPNWYYLKVEAVLENNDNSDAMDALCQQLELKLFHQESLLNG